jgi:hypothetical protein
MHVITNNDPATAELPLPRGEFIQYSPTKLSLPVLFESISNYHHRLVTQSEGTPENLTNL